MQAPH